jgi:hypothetical protein
MISRLLLVGMVGVLGISLPDGANLGHGLTWARSDAMDCVRPRATVLFEPIAVDDDSINRVADELNRQSEGMDLPMVSTAQVVAIARPVAVETVDVVDELFAENRVWGEAAAVPVASITPTAPAPRPVFEPIATTEGATSIADELNRTSEGLDLDPAAVAARTPRRPSFEPIEVVDVASSVVDELNRASEDQTVVEDAQPTLGAALGLTRDAAMAWMNVLTRATANPDDTR